MPGDAGLLDEPARELEALDAARLDAPARSLTVTGRPEPSRAARATATAVSGSLISAAPAPVFITFGTGQPMLRSMRSAPRAATSAAAERMIVRVLAEQLDRDRPARALVRVDDEQLVERLAVAVVDREARDHLADTASPAP